MQFILSEDEYKKLIHKDRIKGPVDEFIKELTSAVKGAGAVEFVMNPNYLPPWVDRIGNAIRTLQIKLDL